MIATPTVFFVYSILLAQDSPAPGSQAAWPAEFYAGATGSHFDQGPSYSGWQGEGSASATWYVVRPLVDDGTPLGIQGYLQRLSQLHLSCGGTATAGSDGASSYRYSSKSMYVSPSGFFYLGGMILGAGAYYYRLGGDTQPADGSPEQHQTTQLFYPWVTAGLRSDALEIYGTYRYRTYYDDGAKRPSTWGQASLRLRNTVDDAIYWRLDAYTLSGGAGGAFHVEAFFAPTLGAWLEGYFETGGIYVNTTNEYSREGGEIGVGWWASHRFELQFSLRVSSASRNGGYRPATTTVGATLGVVLRGPQRDRAQPAGDQSPSSVVRPSPPAGNPPPASPPVPSAEPRPPREPPASAELPAPATPRSETSPADTPENN